MTYLHNTRPPMNGQQSYVNQQKPDLIQNAWQQGGQQGSQDSAQSGQNYEHPFGPAAENRPPAPVTHIGGGPPPTPTSAPTTSAANNTSPDANAGGKSFEAPEGGLEGYAEPGREFTMSFEAKTTLHRTENDPVVRAYAQYQQSWVEVSDDNGNSAWIMDKTTVLPDREGLEVLAEPGREYVGALAPGSTFEFTGTEQKDEDGLVWREVAGMNAQGAQIKGWIQPEPQAETGAMYSVVPLRGTKVYSETDGETRIAALAGGSFVEAQGEPYMTEDGREVIKITGQTLDGQKVTGLVDTRYIKENDSGVMGSTGRENPLYKSDSNFEPVMVARGDNLWTLAAKYGVPYEEFTRTNAHLAEGYLHPGDIIYVPAAGDPAPDEPVSNDAAPGVAVS